MDMENTSRKNMNDKKDTIGVTMGVTMGVLPSQTTSQGNNTNNNTDDAHVKNISKYIQEQWGTMTYSEMRQRFG